ncbi:MAG: glutathione S-transferase [Parvularcula sp.]|nr:glutathione S-transferase [Parvularcula sp.]
MILHDCAGAVNPRRIRMFLAEKGIDIECTQVDVFKGEQYSDEFAKLNPSKAVPCLELDNGEVIAESVAIARYFEASQPEPRLLGETPKEQAVVAMWQRRVEDGLLGASTTYFHHATDGLGETDRYRNQEWGEANKSRVVETMRWLDRELGTRPFIASETFSFADITALCGVDFATFIGVPIPDDCLNLKSWHDRVSVRPSAKA